MNTTNDIDTPWLALRKTPYGETSLIVTGVTPTQGTLGFLLRGERSLGKRRFPTVDLFRLQQVRCRPGRGDLHVLRAADLVRDFGGVARKLTTFRAAGWLARFALRNLMPHVEHPDFFQALLTTLARLQRAAEHPGPTDFVEDAVVVLLGLPYLDEGGWLNRDQETERTRSQIHTLLAAAQDPHHPLPPLSPHAWHELRQWTETHLRHADCHLPPRGRT